MQPLQYLELEIGRRLKDPKYLLSSLTEFVLDNKETIDFVKINNNMNRVYVSSILDVCDTTSFSGDTMPHTQSEIITKRLFYNYRIKIPIYSPLQNRNLVSEVLNHLCSSTKNQNVAPFPITYNSASSENKLYISDIEVETRIFEQVTALNKIVDVRASFQGALVIGRTFKEKLMCKCDCCAKQVRCVLKPEQDCMVSNLIQALER